MNTFKNLVMLCGWGVKAGMFVRFCMRHSQSEMCIGHVHLCMCVCLCLCVCLSVTAFPHYCMDPDVSWGNGRGCPIVVHYCADLQSVHRFHCYDNIAPNVQCQQVLLLALCLVPVVDKHVGGR